MEMEPRYKAFLSGMLFGAFLMFILLLPTKAYASSYADDRFCLAQNIYFEAGNQPYAGRVAVANVTLNRVDDLQFPNDICGVVYQSKSYYTSWKGEVIPKRGMCQFSWYCDGKSDEPKQKETYKRLLTIAESIVYNKLPFIDITDGALFYHADYVKPAWAKTKIKTVEIQDHIFYRWEIK